MNLHLSDQMAHKSLLSCFTLIMVFAFPPARASEEIYLPVGPNVSFTQVLELPFRTSDYRISYGDDPLQFGQLWLPGSDSLGLLVFIHGGCWLNVYGIDHAQAAGAALASAGYAVWSLEYRRTGDSGGAWPGTFNDVVAGINKVMDLAQYGVSTEQLALIGHSAGGHLAVLAGARSELLEVEPDLVVGVAAITDVVSYSLGDNSCQQATPSFMGGSAEEREVAFYEANPGNHGVHPVTVLLHGDVDQIVPLSQASLPGAITRISEGVGHFDWVHPGTTAFRELLKTLAREL